ncbi:MAG: DNA recombination protein RmuC [Rickettsiaceae bacterium]
MILYTAIGFGLILSVALIVVLYNRFILKLQLDNANQLAEEEKQKNTQLELGNIEYIKEIERLKGQLKYQEQLINEFKKLKIDTHESAKAALFDLGSQLSKQLIDIHKKENLETRTLSEKNIQQTTSKFNAEFERIVGLVGSLNKEITQSKDTVDIIKNSLLSPSGAGSLAEITLENILKSSGLSVGVDFIMQYNITDSDNQITLRPDAVVFLPANKLMVIDAKASKFLVDYQGNADKLAKTMNDHLRSLNNKDYAKFIKRNIANKEVEASSCVTLMFLPSEHAIEKLMEVDRDFMQKAWKNDILPVGPAGLINMLSFAKFQISEQMIVHNHLQIIEEVKKLIASVGSMAQHSMKLGSCISNTVNQYDKFAASFNSNFLSKAHKIRKMGVDGGLKKDQESLKRLQLFISKAELIEIEDDTTKDKLAVVDEIS